MFTASIKPEQLTQPRGQQAIKKGLGQLSQLEQWEELRSRMGMDERSNAVTKVQFYTSIRGIRTVTGTVHFQSASESHGREDDTVDLKAFSWVTVHFTPSY